MPLSVSQRSVVSHCRLRSSYTQLASIRSTPTFRCQMRRSGRARSRRISRSTSRVRSRSLATSRSARRCPDAVQGNRRSHWRNCQIQRAPSYISAEDDFRLREPGQTCGARECRKVFPSAGLDFWYNSVVLNKEASSRLIRGVDFPRGKPIGSADRGHGMRRKKA